MTTPPARRGLDWGSWLYMAVLIVVAIVLLFDASAPRSKQRGSTEPNLSKAQLGCATLARAIVGWQISNIGPGATDDNRLPESPRDLLKTVNGKVLLENGEADLYDPWGKPYEFELRYRADGTPFIVVRTTAPDGTLITQYGIGRNAEPREK
jgi:hypothetical protein